MAEVKSHFTEYPLMELFWNIGKNFGLGLHCMLILSTVVQFICFDARWKFLFINFYIQQERRVSSTYWNSKAFFACQRPQEGITRRCQALLTLYNGLCHFQVPVSQAGLIWPSSDDLRYSEIEAEALSIRPPILHHWWSHLSTRLFLSDGRFFRLFRVLTVLTYLTQATRSRPYLDFNSFQSVWKYWWTQAVTFRNNNEIA